MKKISFDSFEIKKSAQKVDFEFQSLCIELEAYFKTKQVWTLPHKVGMTESKLRDAHKVCEKKGITSFRYLMGVLKKK